MTATTTALHGDEEYSVVDEGVSKGTMRAANRLVCHRTGEIQCRESSLVLACLKAACEVIWEGPRTTTAYQAVHGTYREACYWFRSTSMHAFSFLWCCEVLTDISGEYFDPRGIVQMFKRHGLWRLDEPVGRVKPVLVMLRPEDLDNDWLQEVG